AEGPFGSRPRPPSQEAAMSRSPSCPDAQHLQQFVLGQLPEPEAEGIEQHLSQCGRCSQTLHTLTAEDTFVETLRAQAAASQQPLDERTQGLIQRLKGVAPAGSDQTQAATVAAGPAPQAYATQAPTQAEGPAPRPGEGAAVEVYDFLAPPQAPDELGRLG